VELSSQRSGAHVSQGSTASARHGHTNRNTLEEQVEECKCLKEVASAIAAGVSSLLLLMLPLLQLSVLQALLLGVSHCPGPHPDCLSVHSCSVEGVLPGSWHPECAQHHNTRGLSHIVCVCHACALSLSHLRIPIGRTDFASFVQMGTQGNCIQDTAIHAFA